MVSNGSDSGVSILDLMCKDQHSAALDHKRRRDELSKESKNWMELCKKYNEMSKTASVKAAEAKKERDECNAKIKELKEKRNEYHAKAASLKEKGGDEYEAARLEGNKIHEEMMSYTKRGQLAHSQMIQFYDDVNVSKKLATAAYKKSKECRKMADKEHEAFVGSMKFIKDMKDDMESDK